MSGHAGSSMTIHKTHPCHRGNCQAGRAGSVKYLVIHYVGALGGAEANARYYGSTPGIGASAHYFVDHGPGVEVWASVAEGDTAWHCGTAKGYRHPECRNANSIGIEMCCRKDQAGRWYFDDATVDRTVELARDIMGRYGIDGDHVVRHYDVTGKRCPGPYVDDPAAWEAFKARLAQPAPHGVGPSPWAALAWKKAHGKGVFDGTNPQGALTREQAAVVLDRLHLI